MNILMKALLKKGQGLLADLEQKERENRLSPEEAVHLYQARALADKIIGKMVNDDRTD